MSSRSTRRTTTAKRRSNEAAEKKQSSKKTAGEKTPRKGAGKKTTKSNGADSTSEQDAVDWDKDDHKLSMSLMTAITDDDAIARALFPKVGPNPSTRSGGGKPKTDHYWELCKVLFTDHLEYGAAFAPALQGNKTDRKAWTTKIKNRLRRMITLVNNARKTLGKTGEGIKAESDISDDLPVEFLNKWQEVKSKCPYFFELRALIAERPNHIPTGLGNSDTGVEPGVMLDGAGSTMEGDLDQEGEGTQGEGGKAAKMSGDESEDSSSEGEGDGDGDGEGEGQEGEQSSGELDSQIEISAGRKRKSSSSKAESTGKGKTAARPSTSTPVKTSTPQPKKFKSAVAFEEVVKSEETTRQKELDVQAEKWRYNTEKVKAKVEHERLKVEILRLKMEGRKERAKAKAEAEALRHGTPNPLVPYDPLLEAAPFTGGSASGSGSHTPSTSFTGDMYNFTGSFGQEGAS